MARSLPLAVLLVFVWFFLIPSSRAEDPLHSHIPDAVFLKAPSLPKTIEGQQGLDIGLQYDYDRCKAAYGSNYYEACQRRLGLDGRDIAAGITVTPPIKGKWRWGGDYALTFTPTEYWRAGESYQIELDLDALGVPDFVVFGADQRKATATLSANPLTVVFSDMKYMQDPDDPAHKLVSARMDMNYPVTPAALWSKTRVEIEQERDGDLKILPGNPAYEIVHAASGMSAMFSAPLKMLPDRERYMRISVYTGLAPLHGGKVSSKVFTERARIPDVASYLNIDNTAALIARAESGEPRQTLSITTNIKAKPRDVLANTQLYLLPAQHPVTKRSDKKSSSEIYEWKSSEVTTEILALSKPLPLLPMDQPQKDVTDFGFTFEAPEGRYLFLKTAKGFPAFGGYVLGRDYTTILQAPSFPHDIEIMQEGSILTLSGARKVSLHARGADKLTLDIAHIRTGALQHFISQTEGDIRRPSFVNWRFGRDDIAEIDTKDVPMNYQSPSASQYAAFDFSPYLKDGKKGLFLVGVQGWKGDEILGDAQQRFVLVTDMGLLVKQGAKGGRDIYLMSFTTGKPMAGADISVLGRNGLPVFTGRTDSDGHVAFTDPGTLVKDRQPVAITAQRGSDFTFIPYDREDRSLNMSKFDVGGAVTAGEGMNAFLFTDRGIYRPGETAHVGSIVRNADWTLLPPDLPLQLIVKDPRGRIVRDEILKTPPSGLTELTLETQEGWATGTYRVSLHVPQNGEPGTLLGSASFRVEDFQPDRLKIKTVFSKESEGWVNPGGLSATVTLNNLYGTPATQRRITGSVTLNPGTLNFKAFPDFQFYDSYAAKPRAITYDLPDAVTDDKGQAVLPLKLETQDAATYTLNLQSKGFEAGGGRGVSAYASVLVSPMEYAIGFKSAARLDYLKKGQSHTVRILAVDSALKARAVGRLTRELVRKTYVATLVKRDDGSYAYESVPREEVVSSGETAIAAAGIDVTLPTDEIGTFFYRLKNADGRTVADIAFSVAGEGQRLAGTDREAVLNVKIDKASYGPGESIELNISAPYAGAGLITLESDHVLAHRWFQTETSDTVQSITVPADFSGKGYVSVAFVRDINSREIYMSPLSYAAVPFIANTEARTVKIALNVPEKVKPGAPVSIGYSGNMKGKAIVYAIDEGILQVARYKTPDPVDFFLLNRALQVRTSQMLDLLMPEYDLVRTLSATGGDESGMNGLGKYLNPFKRRQLAPAVFWSGIVDLDRDEKTVTFTPPSHFNGQMRVMAVAVADAGIGSAEKAMTVQGDIVITPNAPVFMAPGDEAEASVTVANNIPGSGDADFALTYTPSSGLALSGEAPATLRVPEGQEKTVAFRIKATDVPGGASLGVEAKMSGLSAQAETTLSVRPAAPSETTMTAGYAENGEAKIALTRKLYPQFAERQVSLSALPTSYIYGLARYLDAYPYGCTEQTVSQAFPHLSLAGQPEFGVSAESMKQKIGSAVDALRLRQTVEGGFSLWEGGQDNDDFVTVYALDLLMHARDAGQPVPLDMIDSGLRYLREWINQDVRSMTDAREKAYGIYILTRGGIVTTNEILHLLKYLDNEPEWQKDLSAVYIAASYKLMQQGEQAEETLKKFETGLSPDDLTYRNGDWSEPWYNPFIKYAQYISVVSRQFPERMKEMDRQIVFRLAAFIREERYNTLSAAYAIDALQDYARIENANMAERKITAAADGQSLALEGNGPFHAPVPVEASALNISDGGKPLFYIISETGYDKTIPAEPEKKQMQIERTWLDKAGKPLTGPVPLGDVVEAVLTVRSFDSRDIADVAIVDLLPGGFELEKDDDTSTTADFIDRREDRIILFDTAKPEGREYRYRLRATAKGVFTAPPPYAEAMYELTTKARGQGGQISVQ